MRSLPVLALLLGTAALGGCGADPYAGETPENAIHVYIVGEMKGFDPAQTDEEVSSLLCQNVYDTLYEFHYLKRPFELVPCLADGMPEVTDERIYRIRLKQGVRFVDDPCFPDGRGREVTAQDVVFCLKRLADGRVRSNGSWLLDGVKGIAAFTEATAKGPKYRSSYEDVEGLRATDRYALQIEYEQPQPLARWFLSMGYTSVYPPEAVARYGEEFPNHAVGCGPYVVREFVRKQKLVLDRNPGYREDLYPSEGEPSDDARGRLADAGKRLPLNDRVVATVFEETQPMWLFFEQGYLDRTWIPNSNFDVAVDAVTRTLRGPLAAKGVVLEKTPREDIVYECFNMLDPVVGAPAGEKGRAIRRAMSLADDQEWVAHVLYNDRVQSVHGPLLPDLPGYDPAFRNPWKRRDDETREQALVRARKILADAGHPDGRGIPTIVYDTEPDSTNQQFYTAFARDMRDIGITLRPNLVTWQEKNKRIDERLAQMWGISWGADYPDAQTFLQLFYGPRAPSPNGSNYANPEYDRIYEEAVRLGPGPRRDELYRRLQQIVVDDCVWVFRFQRTFYNLDQSWFHNFKYNDLYLKYFKYCRSDPDVRRARTQAWNRPATTPVWILAGVVLLLGALTLLAVRRTRTAW